MTFLNVPRYAEVILRHWTCDYFLNAPRYTEVILRHWTCQKEWSLPRIAEYWFWLYTHSCCCCCLSLLRIWLGLWRCNFSTLFLLLIFPFVFCGSLLVHCLGDSCCSHLARVQRCNYSNLVLAEEKRMYSSETSPSRASLHDIQKRAFCLFVLLCFVLTRDLLIIIVIIIIRNTYIAPNPTRLAQSTSQFKTRMNIRINTWNMHIYTRRSNTNSKVQANMHTSRNNQSNPDMQCSNTWTMDTSHDCKSNTNSIKKGSTGRFGRTSGFSIVT